MQSLFVSSTFKDMQGERDALHRLVIPRLREKARNHNEHLQFVDLRWGISTTDMDSDEGAGKILEVCLDEIRQCKPYMIVLLGERYGWMPSPALLQGTAEEKNFSLESYEMSVTELEIQYGLYLAQGQIDRCVFCLREELPEETLPEELRDIYVADSDADRQRMRRLREKICSTPGVKVIHYHLDWDAEKRDFTGYENFADRLSDTLETVLSGDWKIQGRRSWRARQREEDKLLIQMHQNSFVGRETQLQEIMEAIDNHQVVILEGEGGCGKSALMAQLLKHYKGLRRTHAEMYCCGNSNYCVNVSQLMELMLFRAFVLQGDNYFDSIVNKENLRDYFNYYMGNLSTEKLYFFIDAIDQLTPDRALYESWFIPPEISENIKIVISTTGAMRVNPLALPKGNKGASSTVIRLEPPEGEDLRKILEARFLAEHKQISKVVADKILENPCSKNMLGMEVMVRRLVMLGKEDFQKIAELEKSMDGNQAIDTYLIQIVEKMPKELHQLIIDYIDDVCKFLDAEKFVNIQLPMYLIALPQHGFSADQMERLAEFIKTDSGYRNIPEDSSWRHFWDPVLFARMKRYLGNLVIQRTDGRVDYSHRLLREALLTRVGVDNIAQVVRYWLYFEPQDDITRLENILVFGRLFEDSNIRQKEAYQMDPVLIRTFVQDMIYDSDKLLDDPDPKIAEKGKEQMDILQQSIFNDLRGEDGWKHLNTYCKMLESMIKDGGGPNNYFVWFFGVKMCALLEKQGDREKVMAVQILCRLITSLEEERKERIEKQTEDWNPVGKRRMLLYYSRVMRMLADLWFSWKLGLIKIRTTYGLNEKRILEQGIALADECIAEDPERVILYIRKAQIYSDCASFARDVHFGGKNNKQTKLVERAMAAINQALLYAEKEDDSISRHSFCIMIISRCIQTMAEVYKNQIFGSKSVLKTAEEYFDKAWDLAEKGKHSKEMRTDDVAKLLLAWRELNKQKAFAYGKQYKTIKQMTVDRLFGYYHNIRGTDRQLNNEERAALANIAVEICQLMMEGYLPKDMEAKGYGRRSLLRYIIEKEGGYIQSQARSDLTSRWNWAVMLCSEALYDYDVYPDKFMENAQRANAVLQILLQDQKDGYCMNITDSDIKNKIEFMERLMKQTKEKAEQQAKV